MNVGFRESLQAVLSRPIQSLLLVTGGCISDAWQVRTAEKTVFVKLSKGLLPGMLAAEAGGLHELAKSGEIRVPEVIRLTEDFLILEFIPTAINPPTDFWSKLGWQLANLHAYSQKIPGFHKDNFIGRSPQKSHCTGSWKEFFWQRRLLPQWEMALLRGIPNTIKLHWQQLEILWPAPLEGSSLLASLLHGDLWSGNVLVCNNGEPVVIDPAVYYGDAEADLSLTYLFGGFPTSFYQAYHEIRPKCEGFARRQKVYQLYHLLNHFNLFGNSYTQSVESCLREITR
ncbi:MAG: fructosamine kinase family protein [SAR324 cluster bacterium]|nr:fructosamine kinase family protein [SAR324 cluster bacterium]